MPDSGFHFAQPLWLWGLLVIPLVLAWLMFSSPIRRRGLEDRYADAHLLPHLSGVSTVRTARSTHSLISWILVWTLLVLAMAGPRWGYRQMNPFEPRADLVVLLDISGSMNVMDVAPSRLDRARQEIQDLVESKHGMRIGLIAFATIAHVVTPITEDGDSLLRQLPALSSDLVSLKGSRLSEALDRASRLLAGQGDDVVHNILLVSDGDFADAGIERQVRALYDNGIRTHVLAMGTSRGGLVPDLMAPNGDPVLSQLDEDGLRLLADAGGGVFQIADFRDADTDEILDTIMSQAKSRQIKKMHTLVWNEYFYLLLLPAMALVLLLFGPGGKSSRFSLRRQA